MARAVRVRWPAAAIRSGREKEGRGTLLGGRVWSEPAGIDAVAVVFTDPQE